MYIYMPEESSNIVHLSVFDNDIDWLPHQPTQKHRLERKAVYFFKAIKIQKFVSSRAFHIEKLIVL